MRELVAQRDSWTGSRALQGSRSSGVRAATVSAWRIGLRIKLGHPAVNGPGSPREEEELSTSDIWRFAERPGADAWQERAQSCERQESHRAEKKVNRKAPRKTSRESTRTGCATVSQRRKNSWHLTKLATPCMDDHQFREEENDQLENHTCVSFRKKISSRTLVILRTRVRNKVVFH